MKSYKTYLAEKKEKIIVYHGTGSDFNKFDLNKTTQKLIWFTNDKQGILDKEKGAQGHGYLLTLEVTYTNAAGWDEYDKLGLWELQSRGYDAVILPDPDGTFDGFVFKNSQVKIIKKEKLDE